MSRSSGFDTEWEEEACKEGYRAGLTTALSILNKKKESICFRSDDIGKCYKVCELLIDEIIKEIETYYNE